VQNDHVRITQDLIEALIRQAKVDEALPVSPIRANDYTAEGLKQFG
jgi:hypothetical protein